MCVGDNVAMQDIVDIVKDVDKYIIVRNNVKRSRWGKVRE